MFPKSETTNMQSQFHDHITFGSHEEVLNDLRPLYLVKRFLAGLSNGVSTSSGYSETQKGKKNISNETNLFST